jgi:hypothetical protein
LKVAKHVEVGVVGQSSLVDALLKPLNEILSSFGRNLRSKKLEKLIRSSQPWSPIVINTSSVHISTAAFALYTWRGQTLVAVIHFTETGLKNS